MIGRWAFLLCVYVRVGMRAGAPAPVHCRKLHIETVKNTTRPQIFKNSHEQAKPGFLPARQHGIRLASAPFSLWCVWYRGPHLQSSRQTIDGAGQPEPKCVSERRQTDGNE